jgi:RNA polymerase sigma-70 factor, ECF subfamily
MRAGDVHHKSNGISSSSPASKDPLVARQRMTARRADRRPQIVRDPAHPCERRLRGGYSAGLRERGGEAQESRSNLEFLLTVGVSPSRQVHSGMTTAFAQELVTLLPRFRRFAISLTGRAQEADDLVQAACERALRAHEQWEPGTRLDSWMFCIIRNLWIDQVRMRSRRGTTVDLTEAENVPGDDGVRRVESALTLNAVRAAIDRMPADLRAVLERVCLQDMSYRATAESLAIPIGTVMSRLARARRLLASDIGLVDPSIDSAPTGGGNDGIAGI